MTTPMAEGFDGSRLRAGDRVELHPGCDLWMRGARFGEVQKITADRRWPTQPDLAWVHVALDRAGTVRMRARNLRGAA